MLCNENKSYKCIANLIIYYFQKWLLFNKIELNKSSCKIKNIVITFS